MPKLSIIEDALRDLAKGVLPEAKDFAGPDRGTVYFWDTSMKGFGVRWNRDNSIVFVFKVPVNGKTHWMALGEWTGIRGGTKVADARSQVAVTNGRIKAGENPQKSRLSPILWEDLVEKFEAKHLPSLKPKTQASYGETQSGDQLDC